MTESSQAGVLTARADNHSHAAQQVYTSSIDFLFPVDQQGLSAYFWCGHRKGGCQPVRSHQMICEVAARFFDMTAKCDLVQDVCQYFGSVFATV